MGTGDPFAILEIAPTRDLAIIKRAYFAGLAKWPPHAAPEGFRKLRAAYEILSDPRAGWLAFLRAPIDVEAELARFAADWGGRLDEAARRTRHQRRTGRATSSFVARIAGTTYHEVTRAP